VASVSALRASVTVAVTARDDPPRPDPLQASLCVQAGGAPYDRLL